MAPNLKLLFLERFNGYGSKIQKIHLCLFQKYFLIELSDILGCSVTRKKFLDPWLKKVIKYFVVSLDMKFGCNVMYVCLLSWLGHTLALWFAKQDFLKKMTHGPKGVSKSAKKSICKQCLGGHETDIISSLPKTPWSPDFSSPAASLISRYRVAAPGIPARIPELFHPRSPPGILIRDGDLGID